MECSDGWASDRGPRQGAGEGDWVSDKAGSRGSAAESSLSVSEGLAVRRVRVSLVGLRIWNLFVCWIVCLLDK